MKKVKTMLATSLLALSALANAQTINLYGPGGPHHALKEIANNYMQKHQGIEIKINFGPQAKWQAQAEKDVDILFGTSEQSALAIGSDFGDKFDIKNIMPIAYRKAIILTKKGNPLKIKGLKDLATRKDVRIVVLDGAGKSNTSGTGVWEDMIGRTKSLDMIKQFRANIVAFVPNSGSAKKLFDENKADTWITWIDWYKANQNIGDKVEIEKSLVIYRTINILPKTNADAEVQKFVQYLNSNEAYRVLKKYGYRK